jgi:EAL domain-containing protein (putative c-di-GMP-specific phosphodiesterase class I)
LFVTSRLVLALAGAELVAAVLLERSRLHPGTAIAGPDLVAILVLALVWLVLTFALLVAGRAAWTGRRPRHEMSELRGYLVATTASILIVSPLLTAIPGWWLVLVAVPLFAWSHLATEVARREQRMGREPSTGLLNRHGLAIGTEALAAEDLLNPARPRTFGIVLVNVEALLTINRALGREMYEKAVAQAADRLIQAYGDDRVGRLAGEGFVILVPDMTSETALAQAEEAVGVVTPRIIVEGIPFSLDPVGGVALSPEHGRELGTLLAKAELAVSEVRRRGGIAMVYVREAAEVARRRIDLLGELNAALHDPARSSEVAVVYQPQIEISTGRLSGVEALVRWSHPQWGPIRTDELIEAIEPSEVMHLLTRHMLNNVAQQLRQWRSRGLTTRAAVNVSVQDLHLSSFVDELDEVIGRTGITASQLTVEITEGMLISDPARVAHAADAISRLGVGLSLDDFGTGYASMQQLRLLPLTEVKIDRSYVAGMAASPSDLAIVTSVHELARTLQLDVVAEGVEDEPTAAALSRLPGTIGQGWFFAHPMPAADLEAWQRSRRTAQAHARRGG